MPNTFGHTAEHGLRQLPAAMTGHRHQIRIFLYSRIDDALYDGALSDVRHDAYSAMISLPRH